MYSWFNGWCICTHSSPPPALRLQTGDLRLSSAEHNILIITITSPIPAASWQHYLHRYTEEGGCTTSKLWTDSTYPLGTTDVTWCSCQVQDHSIFSEDFPLFGWERRNMEQCVDRECRGIASMSAESVLYCEPAWDCCLLHQLHTC